MCSGGGDGGAAKRQAGMKREQDLAIQDINHVFGKGDGQALYKNVNVPGEMQMRGWEQVQGPDSTKKVISGYDTTGRDANAAAREQLYGTITNDSEARLLDQLGDDRTKAERGVRFQLARQGLMGGSADIDQGSEVLEQFQKGSLEARNASTAVSNTARTSDEKTRVGLINNIRNGMAQSDALSAAYAGMTNNANEARDTAMATNIGGFFDDISILGAQRQYQDGLQRGVQRGRGFGASTSASQGGFNGDKRP